MSDPEPTVFVIDDDPSVCKAVSRLLATAGFNVVSFNSAQKFLDSYRTAVHGCIVLDVGMPGLSGLELQETLEANNALLPIIFLTGRADIHMTVQAMKRGAVDVLTKPVQAAELLSAVHTAVARDRAQYLAQLELAVVRSRLSSLTPREYEVLQRVVSGKLNKEAAAELGIAEKTIKVHRARVMEKMQVQSIADLVRLSERTGLHQPDATS